MDFESCVAPCTSNVCAVECGTPVIVCWDLSVGLRFIRYLDGFEEDVAIKVCVETVMLVWLAAVVEAQWLVSGEWEEIGGLCCSIWVDVRDWDGCCQCGYADS